METITTIIKALKLFLWSLEFMSEKISETMYISKVRRLKKLADQAKKGDLNDRLRAGKEIESEINK